MDRSAKPHKIAKTIAVVENDPAVRNSLKFSLEIEGYHVRTCARGSELFGLIHPDPVQCVILEHRLEDISGIELVDRLRARDYAFPIVMLATHPDHALQRQADWRKISIVEKPILGNALTDKLRELHLTGCC
jgi:FixJ family two-component response regulator